MKYNKVLNTKYITAEGIFTENLAKHLKPRVNNFVNKRWNN